jgi:hypothetical protein
MLNRQRGLTLLGVASFSIVFAGIAMVALMSARHERNYFAEGWAKVTGKVAASPVGEAVKGAAGAAGVGNGTGGAAVQAAGPMRKCVIDGKTVISNVDCSDKNTTSREIKIYETKGVESPKAPAPADSAPRSDPMLDKAIEKQMH